MRRRIPRWSDLEPLLGFGDLHLDPVERRLSRVADVGDLRRLARRRTPRAVFDYVDGAAEEEISLARARAAFRRIELRPRVLRDVREVDTSTTILGRPASLPLVLAPTGFTRMMHHEGERAVAAVAARAGIPYTLSTMGTTSIEDLATSAPDATLWFQLYVWRDRDASEELIRRVSAAGYQALMLTVDTAVAGARLRDVRNGLTIPPSLRLRTVADMATHPAWWFNLLTTEPLQFASLRSSGGTLADLVNRMFDPSVTFEDIGWLRDRWSRPLIVKGVQSVADARELADRGVDAIVLSNHGGRQLDRAPTPLQLLGPVLDAVGDRMEVYVDTGITNGADIVAAVGLGARAALVGRAYLYGLMAGGQRGVQRAVDLLAEQFRRTQQLLGVANVADLSQEYVVLRDSLDC